MKNSCHQRARRASARFILAAFVGGLACCFPAAVAWPAPAAVIVYPPDKALLLGDGSLEMLGYRSKGTAGTVTITGKSGVRSQPVGAGAFVAKVTLDPGVNILALGERSISVFLGAKDAAANPGNYSVPDTHAVDNGCEECHAFSDASAKLLEKPPALCSRCHDDVLKGREGKPQAVLHPPAEEGDCLGCHAFHGFSIKKMSSAAKRELCFGCHDDFTGGGKKRMHVPVAKGECTGCHNPHGASEKKLLRASGVKLCLLCHADPSRGKEGEEFAVPHPALDDGCPTCHLPHVSDSPRLLIKPVAQLCSDCHDPFPTEEEGKELVLHSPVDEGECAACHRVHGSEQAKLLAAPGKALCLQCHDDPSLAPGGESWPVEHPALEDGCPTCHLPHVAPAAGMLKQGQPQLCYECHDAFAPPAAGSNGSMHLPVAQGQCSRCHNPHGSAVNKLLLADPGRELCLTCHKDPTIAIAGEPLAVPHPALDDGCPSCHRPHVAAAPRLLAKLQGDLCADCHEDKRRNSEGEDWVSSHKPVANGLCASCHSPHGSSEGGLLKAPGNELCRNCHDEVHERHLKVELDPDSGQPVNAKIHLPPELAVRKRDGQIACTGCHQTHGADNPQLRNKSGMMFCVDCHPM